jgi:hypothetical protein
MGSGTFPLDRKDKDAKVLLEAVKKIDDFIEEYWECVYSGDCGGNQFDNAAADGAYLEKLSLAARLIKECVRDE